MSGLAACPVWTHSPKHARHPAHGSVQLYVVPHHGVSLVYRFATPMRTPRAEGMSGRDRILAEAANLQVSHAQIE